MKTEIQFRKDSIKQKCKSPHTFFSLKNTNFLPKNSKSSSKITIKLKWEKIGRVYFQIKRTADNLSTILLPPENKSIFKILLLAHLDKFKASVDKFYRKKFKFFRKLAFTSKIDFLCDLNRFFRRIKPFVRTVLHI